MFSTIYIDSNHTANQLSPRQCEPNDLRVRLTHVCRRRRTVHVHRRSDVRMPHESLLYAHWSSDRIEPRAMCVAKGVRTEVTDTRFQRCSAKHPPHSRIREWQASDLQRRSKHP